MSCEHARRMTEHANELEPVTRFRSIAPVRYQSHWIPAFAGMTSDDQSAVTTNLRADRERCVDLAARLKRLRLKWIEELQKTFG